jgi:hypothetical protein
MQTCLIFKMKGLGCGSSGGAFAYEGQGSIPNTAKKDKGTGSKGTGEEGKGKELQPGMVTH